ncbi:NHLP leader peptide family natural product precursor [Nostoc sp. KVJ3]|uniref:nitrile hydratase subunit alpha n=1 Tax=Nostoc sp. KVJ3 TaxID=457945 RepID=UPI0022386B14|nr:nitrile hydratase subunit alpha [Nostoc sp. KVJ3]MCW5315507.1 NHLP leader peptide family natural product precursor [Nostoc sp. KVJ3]
MVAWLNVDKNRLIVADIIIKVWNDLQYKSMFIAEPKRILQEAGVNNIPEIIEIQVLENTSERQYIVFPEEVHTNDYIAVLSRVRYKNPTPNPSPQAMRGL